jgi:PAS domain S-box-containing protein
MLTCCLSVMMSGIFFTAIDILALGLYKSLVINNMGFMVLAFALAGGISLVVAYILVSRLYRSIANPISNLSELMRSISTSENYNTRAPVFEGDEIGRLTSGFNEMLEQIKKRDDELHRQNSALEEAVGHRTRELAAAKEQLEFELAGRRRAQHDLVLAAHEWRETFDAINDGVCLVRADGGVVRCNRAISRLLNLPFTEIIEKSCCKLLHDHSDGSSCILSVLSEHPVRETRTMQRGNRWYDVTVDPVFDDLGSPRGGVYIMSDITERRELQQKFNQAQKLEAIGRLAGGVAHDFNNLLSVIINYCNLLLPEIPRESPMRGDVVEIRNAGIRAAALTRQLLAFSRKQEVNPEVVDVNAVVWNLSKMLRRLIGEQILFELSLPERSMTVFMDPTQLEQIITNLVVNSRDAMPSGGTITITTSDVSIRSSPDLKPGEYIELAVADTGIGMSNEVMQRIFEPFFTTKEKGKGTGLGLSMVYGAVKQNSGNIEVQSEPGKGTTFRIRLKRCEESQTDAQDLSDSVGQRGNGETIMVVEDDDFVRASISRTLTRYGYNTMGASGGFDAMEKFKRVGIAADLVLTDIVMPDMTGFDLGKKLRELRPGLALLFMTGYSDEVLLEHGTNDCSVPIIHKPIDHIKLLKMLSELIGKNATPSRSK